MPKGGKQYSTGKTKAGKAGQGKHGGASNGTKAMPKPKIG